MGTFVTIYAIWSGLAFVYFLYAIFVLADKKIEP